MNNKSLLSHLLHLIHVLNPSFTLTFLGKSFPTNPSNSTPLFFKVAKPSSSQTTPCPILDSSPPNLTQ